MSKTQEAKQFLDRVRRRVARLKIHLIPMTFVEGTSGRMRCCALGASLALKAKSKAELQRLADQIDYTSGDMLTIRPAFTAGVLGADLDDMVHLESGFEGWKSPSVNTNHPFYRIGRQLRKDVK